MSSNPAFPFFPNRSASSILIRSLRTRVLMAGLWMTESAAKSPKVHDVMRTDSCRRTVMSARRVGWRRGGCSSSSFDETRLMMWVYDVEAEGRERRPVRSHPAALGVGGVVVVCCSLLLPPPPKGGKSGDRPTAEDRQRAAGAAAPPPPPRFFRWAPSLFLLVFLFFVVESIISQRCVKRRRAAAGGGRQLQPALLLVGAVVVVAVVQQQIDDDR